MARAGDYLDSKAATNYAELVELGCVPGVLSPNVLGYVDPIKETAQRPSDEDPQGLEVRQNPYYMLLDDPDLWDITDRFRCNVRKELTHAEFDRLSAWEIEAWVTMLSANAREEQRQIENMRAGNGD